MSKYTPASTFHELAEQMEQIIQSVWNGSLESIRQVLAGKAKNGLTASGLLVCKGGDCQYRTICDIPAEDLKDLPADYPCLHELMDFATLCVKYCDYFKIREGAAVDFEQVCQLVDVEIKLLRCNKFTATNPQIIYNTAEDGSGEKKIHPVALYELRLMEQHSRLLKSLGVFG